MPVRSRVIMSGHQAGELNRARLVVVCGGEHRAVEGDVELWPALVEIDAGTWGRGDAENVTVFPRLRLSPFPCLRVSPALYLRSGRHP